MHKSYENFSIQSYYYEEIEWIWLLSPEKVLHFRSSVEILVSLYNVAYSLDGHRYKQNIMDVFYRF